MTDTAFYADAVATAIEVLNNFGSPVPRNRTDTKPADAEDPGGAPIKTVVTTVVTACRLPLGDRDIRAFGDVAKSANASKFLADPRADLRRGDRLTFGGEVHTIEALSELKPADSEPRCLWMGVIVK